MRTRLLLAAIILPLALNSYRAPTPDLCTDWTQVNDDAFGLPSFGSYAGEEGFEVLVYNGQLYLGMEADNRLGARLWRTRRGVAAPSDQADWEEVIADAAGLPFGVPNVTQNDHVDSLTAFGGALYVSTANGGDSTWGTRVFASAGGDRGTWKDVIVQVDRDGDGRSELSLPQDITAGFGDRHNTNFKDMLVFAGRLCGGTRNTVSGAEVWCTADGSTWVQKNVNGFGDPANVEVWSAHVAGGALFVGVQHNGAGPGDGDDVARVFRTTDVSRNPAEWTAVYSGLPGSYRADILGDLGGYLYIAVRSPEGMIVLRSPLDGPTAWTPVSRPGLNGRRANRSAVVDGAVVWQQALFVAVTNLADGFTLWRTTGAAQPAGLVDWTQVGANGLGDSHNVHSELILFGDYLYAWTTNYVTGQQALRGSCAR